MYLIYVLLTYKQTILGLSVLTTSDMTKFDSFSAEFYVMYDLARQHFLLTNKQCIEL